MRQDLYTVTRIYFCQYNTEVKWEVQIADEFEPEYSLLPVDVQMEVLALARLLQQFGPSLGRPRVDTLKGSRYSNMKELRFDVADGVWRLAFDPKRKAMLLVAGDKSRRRREAFLPGTDPQSGYSF